MAVSINTEKHNFLLWSEAFTEEDSPEGINHFEEWRKNNPGYALKDGDGSGWNILMIAVIKGNIALTQHLVKLMDQNTLHMSKDGKTVFYSGLFADYDKIDKVVKCFEIIIQAGADVNIKGEGSPLTSLERLIDATPNDFSSNNDKMKCMKLFKFFVRAGARCQGNIWDENAKGPRRASTPLLQAQEAVYGWSKTRNIYIAGKDQGSALSFLPQELLYKIHEHYNWRARSCWHATNSSTTLPDSASRPRPPQNSTTASQHLPYRATVLTDKPTP